MKYGKIWCFATSLLKGIHAQMTNFFLGKYFLEGSEL